MERDPHPNGWLAKESGRTLSETSRLSFVSRATDLAHPAGADADDDFIGAEARAGNKGPMLRFAPLPTRKHLFLRFQRKLRINMRTSPGEIGRPEYRMVFRSGDTLRP
jgi:hypothetical protein